MWHPLTLHFSLFATTLPFVSAHGRITNITTSSGATYTGWDPELALPDHDPPPPMTAWSASNLGNIFVPPHDLNTSHISCHYNATPGALHINTTAGETLKLQWNEWPTSHVGPVLTYLAACNGSCATASKTSLEWVKIDEMGWLNSSGWDVLGLGGTWATDVLIKNNFAWDVTIPEALAEGNYVLRHEIIALHVAEEADGAQLYPQCVNVKVGRSRSAGGDQERLEGGVRGDSLYAMNDDGILIDVHRKLDGYTIPGPKLWSGASNSTQVERRTYKQIKI